MPAPDPVPALLQFDVEPDAFQPPRDGTGRWSGYEALFGFARTLRDALARASGAVPTFGWYYRTDPQIEACFGRADHAVSAFPDRVATLRAAGDHFGVHSHPLRWSAAHGLWVHDVADRAWVRECTARSLDVFERALGRPAELFRAGGGLLCEDILDVLEARGVAVDTSLEPIAGWSRAAGRVSIAVDSSPIVGEPVDGSIAPRVPYRPDRADFRLPGGANARRLTLIPLTTGPRRLPPTGWRLGVRRLLGKVPGPYSTRVLYPTARWRSDRDYWDLVAHAISTMERPYVSLGVRTDAADSAATKTVIRRLLALASHPLAKRLRFVHPLEVVARTVEPASAAAPPARRAS